MFVLAKVCSHINVQTKIFRHQSSWEIVPVQSTSFWDCYIVVNINYAGLGELKQRMLWTKEFCRAKVCFTIKKMNMLCQAMYTKLKFFIKNFMHKSMSFT